MEIKSQNTTYEIANTNEANLNLSGSINTSVNVIKYANFTITNSDNLQVNYSVTYYEDGRVSESVNGSPLFIDEAKEFARLTINEFKSTYLTKQA